MLQYDNLRKGEAMEIMPYRLDQSMYDSIESRFPEKRDREIAIFVLEQAVASQSQIVIDTVNRKINQIVYEVKLELMKEFGTKSDLMTMQAILERKILEIRAKITEVKTELKQDIAEVKERLVKNEEKIQYVSEQVSELKQDIKEVRTEIKDVELRLSKDIAEVKTEVAKISTAIETNEKNFGNKIKSLKFEMVGWIAGIMIVIPNIDKIWSFIKTLIQQ